MTRPLELDDLYRIRDASDPQLSPDGTRVAYTVSVADRAGDRVSSSVWLVPTDGAENPRALTAGLGDRAPRWSPDGRFLAYVSSADDDGQCRVQVLPRGGGASRTVAGARGVVDLAWSPDGTTLAFTAIEDRDENDVTAPVVVDRLDHRLDGVGALAGNRRQIFTVPGTGGEPAQLTWGDTSAGDLAWSPDGARLAFSRSGDDELGRTAAICTVNASGGPVDVLTGGPDGLDTAPSWSPDGTTILFARGGAGHTRLFTIGGGRDPVEVKSVAVLDRNVMVGGPGYPGARPRVEPGGDSVLVCVRDGGCTHLYRAPLDGDGAAALLAGDHATAIGGLSVSEDGRMATIVATPGSTGDVVVDGTVVAAHAPADVDLYEPDRRLFDAPDGTPIEGWVIRDPDTNGAGPLLLDIHGGPHNAWSPCLDGVNLWHHVLASRGWTIVFVNPRGSDGYGEDFYRGVADAWGRADTGDFLAAVDALVADGLADRERVAVTGYSYGGYQTCWLTATTDRFAAAVTGGCLSNLVSASGTMDIGTWLAGMEFNSRVGDTASALVDSSPMAHVDGVDTPTLILHGEADLRCPIGQAEEWFTALRSREVPTELVRYPGGSHLFILNGRPSHRIDYARRLIDWVETYATGSETPAPTTGRAARRTAGYQQRLDDLLRRSGVPGVSVAVLAGDEVVEISAGVSRHDRPGDVSADTVFQIGSITKVFTATVIMQFVDEGTVALDDPVRRHLPDFLPSVDGAEVITIRHLLNHSSGLEGDWFEEFDSTEQYVAGLDDLPLLYPVGAMYSYCNAGFVVAGRLIEAVTGQRFEEALTVRLLEPLGIDGIWTADEALSRDTAGVHIRTADGDLRLSSTFGLPSVMAAAGASLSMTAGEVLRFARIHLRGGRAFDETQVLSADAVSRMQRPTIERLFRPNGDAWGLGWGIATVDGHRALAHNGGTLGHFSALRVVPDLDFGVVVLTNGPGAMSVLDHVITDVFDAVIDVRTPEFPRPSSEPVAVDAEAIAGRYSNIQATLDIAPTEDGIRLSAHVDRPLDPTNPPPEPEPQLLRALDATTFVEVDADRRPGIMTFVDPDENGRFRYVHSTRNAFRRTGA